MSVHLLWAKSHPAHPLWCHLIDVGAVAEAAWDTVFSEQRRLRIARSLAVEPSQAKGWFVWLTALHDIGKATPHFQHQVPELMEPVRAAGFPFDREKREGNPHGAWSAVILRAELKRRGWDQFEAGAVANVVGAHHGAVETTTHRDMNQSAVLPAAWETAASELIKLVEESFSITPVYRRTEGARLDYAGLAEVAGLISALDWIGSATEKFFVSRIHDAELFAGSIPTSEYIQHARVEARRALKHFGWQVLPSQIEASTTEEQWKTVFCGKSYQPNPLQKHVASILDQNPKARLLIIEAPMGEGKTEAALFAARHWMKQFDQPGFYLGLPTQATSNAMYSRVDGFLEQLYSKDAVDSLLIHGGLIKPEYFDEKVRKTFLAEFMGGQIYDDDDQPDEFQATTTAHGWFLPSKCALLAPFGTGTIDQALLGALNARHWFVRLAGLAGKTVIFDEIHAYDAYTSRLIARLLEYLNRLDCTVVLLSATLPSEAREQFFAAFGGADQTLPEGQEFVYPKVTAWPANPQADAPVISVSERSRKQLHIEPIPWDVDAALDAFLDRLGESGCGAFIVNLVDEAQELYIRLKERDVIPEDNLILFHSRFPAGRRNQIETEVLDKFGPHGQRPEGRAVMVSTQVAEQSLDLDFDLMASTIAPIDLLLQRSGRMHRHQRPRPAHLATPTLLVRMPDTSSGKPPDYGLNQKIYERAILLRTHAVLRNLGELRIPDDVPTLIEQVYSRTPFDWLPDSWKSNLEEATQQLDATINAQINISEGNSQYSPSSRRIRRLWNKREITKDDDLDKADYQRAVTRLGEDQLSVVLAHLIGDQLYLDPEGTQVLPEFASDEKIPPAVMRSLAENVVKLPVHFKENESEFYEPKGWKQSRVLRQWKVVVLTNGVMKIPGGKVISWDPELGVRGGYQ